MTPYLRKSDTNVSQYWCYIVEPYLDDIYDEINLYPEAQWNVGYS